MIASPQWHAVVYWKSPEWMQPRSLQLVAKSLLPAASMRLNRTWARKQQLLCGKLPTQVPSTMQNEIFIDCFVKKVLRYPSFPSQLRDWRMCSTWAYPHGFSSCWIGIPLCCLGGLPGRIGMLPCCSTRSGQISNVASPSMSSSPFMMKTDGADAYLLSCTLTKEWGWRKVLF